MKVYRFEHCESSFGPYNHTVYAENVKKDDIDMLDRIYAAHACCDYHPYPSDDDLWFSDEESQKAFQKNILFACPSIESLLQWFNGWIDTLEELGFRIYELEVDDAFVKIGKSKLQCSFPSSRISSKKELKKDTDYLGLGITVFTGN